MTRPADLWWGAAGAALHAMQAKPVARCGCRWLYQQSQSLHVAGDGPISPPACSPSCSPTATYHRSASSPQHRAAGTSLTGLFGVGPVIAATVIGDVRDVSRFPGRDHFAAWNGTAPAGVSPGQAEDLPAIPARQPPPQPRHPPGRGHPDPLPAQRRPRLLRQEKGRRQDRQTSPARTETADQRRHLRLPPSRRPARRRQRERPGRATGERLWLQHGRLTPRTPALRTSHSRACHPPYEPARGLSHRPVSRSTAVPRERASGSRTGRSPAAQRRPQGVLDPAAREPIIPVAGKRPRQQPKAAAQPTPLRTRPTRSP
jgi:hypothetical protein